MWIFKLGQDRPFLLFIHNRRFLFAAALALAAAASVERPALAQSGSDFHKFLQKELHPKKILPPDILSVSTFPERPQAGETWYVEAKIVARPGGANKYIKKASALYREKGAAEWKRRKMDEEDENLWSADMGEWPLGAEIEFRVAAEDSEGNLAVETDEETGFAFPENCRDGELCAATLGGWAPPVQLPDDDDIDRDAPPDLDLLGLGAARASQTLTIGLRAEGAVSPGTLQPIYAHGYAILFAPGAEGRPPDLRNPWIWAYAFHASQFGYPHAALVRANQKEIDPKPSGFRYILDGPYAAVEIPLEQIGGYVGQVILIAGDIAAFGSDFQNVDWEIKDLTRSIRLLFRSHETRID